MANKRFDVTYKHPDDETVYVYRCDGLTRTGALDDATTVLRSLCGPEVEVLGIDGVRPDSPKPNNLKL